MNKELASRTRKSSASLKKLGETLKGKMRSSCQYEKGTKRVFQTQKEERSKLKERRHGLDENISAQGR